MLKIYITASAVLAWQEGLKSVHCQYWVDYRRCMDDDSDVVISWLLWPGAGIEGKAGGAFKRRQSLSVSLQNFFNIFIIWIFFFINVDITTQISFQMQNAALDYFLFIITF